MSNYLERVNGRHFHIVVRCMIGKCIESASTSVAIVQFVSSNLDKKTISPDVWHALLGSLGMCLPLLRGVYHY